MLVVSAVWLLGGWAWHPAARTSPPARIRAVGIPLSADTLKPSVRPWSFPVGERAEYVVTFGPVKVGRGTLHVEAIDTIGTRPAYRVAFELQGGPFFYKVNNRRVSWVAPDPIRSLRFEERISEGSHRRHRRYLFHQEAGTYSREDWEEERGGFQPVPSYRDLSMPEAAMDEVAYLYLARTVPLEVGRSYMFHRYFEEESNPVVLEVLRRETVRVPAGRFRTVVVRPIVRAGGMFGDEGRAEVYLSDDDRRVIVLLRMWMRTGEVSFYLRDYDPGREGAFIAARSVARAFCRATRPPVYSPVNDPAGYLSGDQDFQMNAISRKGGAIG